MSVASGINCKVVHKNNELCETENLFGEALS